MKVKLIGHTQLSEEFYDKFDEYNDFLEYNGNKLEKIGVTNGQTIALTAIRTCYSHNKPSEIVELEGEKYFGRQATDGQGGTDADRLIRHIMNSGHTSTMEHLNFTFAIEGVSRSLLAQLTRHRHFSYSVQSQRYVRLESESKSGGFDYVVPETIKGDGAKESLFIDTMNGIQHNYDLLRKMGVPAEDARYILPNAATCNLVLTGNLRSILEFYSKRGEGSHAQWEIKELAEKIKEEVIKVEPWTESFFKVG